MSKIEYVPSPWDAYGPPQVRDVDLPADELDGSWKCDEHTTACATRAECLTKFEKDREDVEREVGYLDDDLRDAQERLDEINDRIAELRKSVRAA